MFLRKITLLIFVIQICSASFALTLRESVDLAMKNNPQIHAQRKRITRAESDVGQVFSGYLPNVRLEGKIGLDYRTPIIYDISPGTSFTLYPDEAGTATGLKAVLSQNLYTGGRLESRLGIAKAGLEITKEELTRKKQELIYGVVVAYYGVARARKLLELSEESVDVAKRHLKQIETYFNVGGVARSDLLRGRVRVSKNELRRIKDQSDLEIAEIKLNDILGREINAAVQVEEMKPEPTAIALRDSKNLLDLAFEHRPKLRILGLRKKMSQGKINLARAEYLPSFRLMGSLSKDITNYSAASINYDVSSWNVGGVFSWTAFDGFKTQNQVKAARAAFAEIEVYENQTRNRIAAELKVAQLYFNAAKLRIRSAKEEVKFAEENLKHALEEYRSGVKRNIEYLEARRLLNGARADLLSAEADFELAKAKINLTVGKVVFNIF